ncbi:hypothetical protein GQ53DRAFT_825294 [Thozetella sp. PMI_491]|nr:hypothetical protein GQ53DRAFT_825294 [Thozetella sp. PMI_491]
MASKHQKYRECEDDDFDFDDEYFERTYRPLSSLPTPPPSSRNSWGIQTPKSLLEDGELLDSELLGPAIHLVNLVPSKASLADPSVAIVHDMLKRAGLPLDTIALAVCILDSLNSKKFSLSWRFACPLVKMETQSKRHTLPAGGAIRSQLNVDCVNPEVIILASLVISVKFLEDGCYEPTRFYNSHWANDRWTDEQINVTERCIMEALEYRILPLWDHNLISDAIADMKRAGKQAILAPRASAVQAERYDDHHKRSMSSGKAVYGLGLQLTPVETPKSETVLLGAFAHGLVEDDVRAAFGAAQVSTLTSDSLHLPPEIQRKGSDQLMGM